MPVYNGSTKEKGLYYGGAKIKEAYYGSTKVYSNGPSYFCYKTGIGFCVYFKTVITSVGNYILYQTDSLGEAQNASQLTNSNETNVNYVNGNDIKFGSVTVIYTRYPQGDV